MSARRVEQSHEILHQYGLSRTALSDYEVCLPVLEGGGNILQHLLVAERLAQILYFNHNNPKLR